MCHSACYVLPLAQCVISDWWVWVLSLFSADTVSHPSLCGHGFAVGSSLSSGRDVETLGDYSLSPMFTKCAIWHSHTRSLWKVSLMLQPLRNCCSAPPKHTDCGKIKTWQNDNCIIPKHLLKPPLSGLFTDLCSHCVARTGWLKCCCSVMACIPPQEQWSSPTTICKKRIKNT